MGDDFSAVARVVSAIYSFHRGRRPVEAEVCVACALTRRCINSSSGDDALHHCFFTSVLRELSAANPDRAKLLGRPECDADAQSVWTLDVNLGPTIGELFTEKHTKKDQLPV
jgi:hypothetical protein